MEIKDWWMIPHHVRTLLDLRVAFEPSSSPYDYGYVPFLRMFIPDPKRCERGGEYPFFNSLARYFPLLLSADVELHCCHRSPALSTSAFNYGEFACSATQVWRVHTPLQPLCGEVVFITHEEHIALSSVECWR